MNIRVADPRDGARICEALLLAAETVRPQKPILARRYIEIANSLGDALDQVDGPNWDGDTDRPELDYRPGPPTLRSVS